MSLALVVLLAALIVVALCALGMWVGRLLHGVSKHYPPVDDETTR